VRGALRVPLVDRLSEPTFVVTTPPIGWWIAALAAGALAGAWLGRWLAGKEASEILRPLLLPGLANLAYVPGALSVVPFLAAISGPLLDLLLLGSLAAFCWRAAEQFGVTLSPSANQVAVVALGLYLWVGHRAQQEVGLTGDEPHYMLIAQSLLRDHDLRVDDDYAEGSFREFYDGKIGPHLAHGTPYSIHGVGLPLLLLPGFALLGLTGVLLTEALLGAVAVRELFRAVELLAGDRRAALLVVVGFGFTAPALFLLTAAYPELPAAVLAVAVFRRWLSSHAVSSLGSVVWGLGFGLLPLLHIKFLPLAAVLGLGSLHFWRGKRWGVLVGMSAGLLGVLTFFYYLTGSFNPLTSWGTQRVFWSGIPRGLAGLLFDQEAGLLPASPFYVFTLVALVSFLRWRPALGFLVVAALAAVALPGAAHPVWFGGTSAPARFLFPALPLLAACAGAVWRQESGRGMYPWARPLLLSSVLFGIYMASVPGQYLYLNQRDGTGRLWEALGASWDLTHYLPSIQRADSRSFALAGAGVAVVLLAVIVQLSGRAVRLPPLAITILVGTVLVDVLSPGRLPDSASGRWMERLLWGISNRQTARFLMLPAVSSLQYGEVLQLIELPLPQARGSTGEEREVGGLWESMPVRLPAGEFVLESGPSSELRLCNGEGCFASARPGQPFQTRVGFSRFHVRSEESIPNLHLRAVRLEADFVTAFQSLQFLSGLRLHSLDDNVFYEPSGFWVRAGSQARFALEQELSPHTVLSLVNGGKENWITVQQSEGVVRFPLRPFEAKRLQIPATHGFGWLAVECVTGFRPVDLEPSREDHRLLGVFVTAPVFDLPQDPSG